MYTNLDRHSVAPCHVPSNHSALYPSLKIQYVIREIDTLLVERIDSRKGEEKKGAEALREIVIPLFIFQLQHQIVYVLSDEPEEKEEKISYFPGDRINDDDHARALFQNSLEANPQLACLSGMDAGISTTGLRVTGVPIGNDEWVQQFVQEKAAAVQVDVGTLDIISDGLIHYQMLRFCQNTRLSFLGRNTPTPLISDISD